MHDHGRPSLARLLAPLALIAVVVAVGAVVLGSGVTGDDGGSPGASNLPAATERTTTAGRPQRRAHKNYTIKLNDTLSGIAERTGVTVDRLQELNPELDSQGLVVGQKIKLRE